MKMSKAETLDMEMLDIVKDIVCLTETPKQAAMVIFLAHEAGVIVNDEAESLSAEQGVAFPFPDYN